MFICVYVILGCVCLTRIAFIVCVYCNSCFILCLCYFFSTALADCLIAEGVRYGQLSKAQRGKMGPAPGGSELSKDMFELKAMVPGS